jgi:hypothetical protein
MNGMNKILGTTPAFIDLLDIYTLLKGVSLQRKGNCSLGTDTAEGTYPFGITNC